MLKTARKEKLHSGIFICEECDVEYELELVPESEVVCDDCGSDLVEYLEDEDEGEEEIELEDEEDTEETPRRKRSK